MARNPLYPRTAGDTAVDRFLNDTLPRLIQARSDRRREDEALEYKKERDIISDAQWLKSYELRKGEILDGKIDDFNNDTRTTLADATEIFRGGNHEAAISMLDAQIDGAALLSLTDDQRKKLKLDNLRLTKERWQKQGPIVQTYLKNVQIMDGGANPGQKENAYNWMKDNVAELDTYWQTDFNEKTKVWAQNRDNEWLVNYGDIDIQTVTIDAMNQLYAKTGIESFEKQLNDMVSSLGQNSQIFNVQMNEQTGRLEIVKGANDQIDLADATPDQVNRYKQYLYENNPAFQQIEIEAYQTFMDEISVQGILDSPANFNEFIRGLPSSQQQRFLETYINATLYEGIKEVEVFNSEGDVQKIQMYLNEEEFKQRIKDSGYNIPDDIINKLPFQTDAQQLEAIKKSEATQGRDTFKNYHLTQEQAKSSKKEATSLEEVDSPDWYTNQGFLSFSEARGFANRYTEENSIKTVQEWLDDWRNTTKEKHDASYQSGPVVNKKYSRYKKEVLRHNEMFPNSKIELEEIPANEITNRKFYTTDFFNKNPQERERLVQVMSENMQKEKNKNN